VILKIDETVKESSIKTPALKATILKETKLLIDDLESKYTTSKIRPSDMKRFFKSLNILLTIYYGPQLPITSHLQTLR
jgi:hypothetical protein